MHGIIFILPDTLKTGGIESDIITDVLITVIVSSFGIVFVVLVIDILIIGRKYGLVLSFIF